MAMKVTYTTIDGEIISENRNGVERDYMPDPLGSTLALLDNTQTKTDTFTYWPYGEVKFRTGTTPTPFQYIGTRGYYQDSSTKTYVRARYLDTQKGRWMTVDPIGFAGGDWNALRYCYSRPASCRDETGLNCQDPCTDPCKSVNWSTYPGVGTVICCNNVAYTCFAPDIRDKAREKYGNNDIALDCIVACAKKHEEKHRDETCKDVCKNTQNGIGCQVPPGEECKAYSYEVNSCLTSCLGSCKGDKQCRDEIVMRICMTCDFMKDDCKKVNHARPWACFWFCGFK